MFLKENAIFKCIQINEVYKTLKLKTNLMHILVIHFLDNLANSRNKLIFIFDEFYAL